LEINKKEKKEKEEGGRVEREKKEKGLVVLRTKARAHQC
jgi:hypothetical protein